MVKYKGYVRPSKRLLLVIEDLSLKNALEFLEDYPIEGVILDYSENELTKEELENVKSIRSLPGIGDNSFFTGGKSVSEDTDRELPGAIEYNPESSTERDNQCD